MIDLMGNKYGRLSVIGKAERPYYWKCRCECGACNDKDYHCGLLDMLPSVRPQETVTEFADRCRECGAEYGRLLKRESKAEQWQELKETITELRDNDGTSTQQEVCKFLVNYMEVLEKQKQEPKTGHWIKNGDTLKCPFCGAKGENIKDDYCFNYCPNCGADMRGEEE